MDQPASQASPEREHLAAQRDRDIEAGVDPVEAIADYEEATRSPELLDGRIREAIHWCDVQKGPGLTTCRYAPLVEGEGPRITWSPITTTDPAQVTCAQCSNRLQSERRDVNVTHIDPDLITALGDLTDTYGVAGVRKTMGILWPIEPVTLAAGGPVSGPSPVLVGEKDGPFLSLADHLELARGKTPQAWVNATAETPIDPADVHADDVMLSAQVQERPELLLVTGRSERFSPLLHQMYPELRLNEFSRLMEQAALQAYERASSLDATLTGRMTFTIVAEQTATAKED